jgi:hypothetical protein
MPEKTNEDSGGHRAAGYPQRILMSADGVAVEGPCILRDIIFSASTGSVALAIVYPANNGQGEGITSVALDTTVQQHFHPGIYCETGVYVAGVATDELITVLISPVR